MDCTSHSAYSALLEPARYGYNKERDDLEQINVFVVCEDETGIPVFFKSVQGNASDRRILGSALNQMRNAEFRNSIILVLDRGFWSGENIRRPVSSDFEFILCVPTSDKLYYETVKAVYHDLTLTENYIEEIRRSCVKVPYMADAPRRGTNEPKELCLYVFYDSDGGGALRAHESSRFVHGLRRLREDHSMWNPESNCFTGKYFIPVCDGKGNTVDFRHNNEAQSERKNMSGVYACLGPKDMNPVMVHNYYKQRQRIEDGFGASKE